MRIRTTIGIVLVAMLLLVPSVFAEIYTGGVSGGYEPLDVCGSYNSEFEIKATIILATNGSNYTSSDMVSASLIGPDDAFTILSDNPIPMDFVKEDESSPAELSWTLSCDENYPGDYGFYILYESPTLGVVGDSSEDGVYSHVKVHGEQLDITIAEPDQGKYYKTIPTLTIVTESKSVCDYELNGDSYNLSDGYSFGHEVQLDDVVQGQNSVTVSCENEGGNEGTKTTAFYYDSQEPVIESLNRPSSKTITEEYVMVEVDTDERAICKISKVSESFTSMDMVMEASPSEKTHGYGITNLEGGLNTFYIRCMDKAGNVMSDDYIVDITVDGPPTAKVDIDGVDEDEVISVGEYEVTLTTSKSLVEKPSLSFSAAGGKEILMKATSDPKVWVGEFEITDDSLDSVIGTFSFSGKDILGRVGTRITEGAKVEVDTKGPSKVEGLKAEIIDGKVRLVWDELEESVSRYRIYKSLKSTSTESDYYASTGTNLYLDAKTEAGTFFYFVAGVDDARNVGTLSEFTRIIVDKEEIEESSPVNTKTEVVAEEPVVDNLMEVTKERIEKDLEEFNQLLEEYKSLKQELTDVSEVQSMVVDFVSAIRAYDEQISLLQSSIKRVQDIDRSVDSKTRILLDDIEEYVKEGKKEIITDVNIVDQKNSVMVPFLEDVELGLESYYSLARLEDTEREKEKNRKVLRELNSEVSIDVEAYSVEAVNYLGDKTYYTVVKESVDDPNVKISTFFGTNVVEDLGEVISDGVTGKYEDHKFVDFGTNDVMFLISKKISLDNDGAFQSIVAPNDFLVTFFEDEVEGSDGITGSAITPIKQFILNNQILLGLIVLTALLAYYFLVIQKDEIETDYGNRSPYPQPGHGGMRDMFAGNSHGGGNMTDTNYEAFNMLVSAFNSMMESKGQSNVVLPPEESEETTVKKGSSAKKGRSSKSKTLKMKEELLSEGPEDLSNKWKELSKQMDEVKKLVK